MTGPNRVSATLRRVRLVDIDPPLLDAAHAIPHRNLSTRLLVRLALLQPPVLIPHEQRYQCVGNEIIVRFYRAALPQREIESATLGAWVLPPDDSWTSEMWGDLQEAAALLATRRLSVRRARHMQKLLTLLNDPEHPALRSPDVTEMSRGYDDEKSGR